MYKKQREHSEEIEILKVSIDQLYKEGQISQCDFDTIHGVFSRPGWLEFLVDEAGKQLDVIGKNLTRTAKHTSLYIEQLRKLSMGVWLEKCSGFALDDNGELQINIDGSTIRFTDEFKRHLEGPKADISSTFYRQAVLRQIERYIVFKANGLFDNASNVQRIADIGAGSLIGSVMLRECFPNAYIDAFEPGLVSVKTRSVADKKEINLKQELFERQCVQQHYDLIVMNFVLEHDVEQSRQLISDALAMLSPQGKIAIAVPNYHAVHRAYETQNGENGRDPLTRLSQHDSYSGHQIIFSADQLIKIVAQEQKKAGTSLPVHAQTILPRPCAFNSILARTKSNSVLLHLENEGHLKGEEDKGSVLTVTIGQDKPFYKTLTHCGERPVFYSLLNAFSR